MFSSAWYGARLRREGARDRRREGWRGGRESWSPQLYLGIILWHVCACWESVIDDTPPRQHTNTHTHAHAHAQYGAITAGPLTPYICCVCAFRAPLVQDSVNNCWMDHVFTAIYSGSSVGGWCGGEVRGMRKLIDVWSRQITLHLVQCVSKHYAQYARCMNAIKLHMHCTFTSFY